MVEDQGHDFLLAVGQLGKKSLHSLTITFLINRPIFPIPDSFQVLKRSPVALLFPKVVQGSMTNNGKQPGLEGRASMEDGPSFQYFEVRFLEHIPGQLGGKAAALLSPGIGFWMDFPDLLLKVHWRIFSLILPLVGKEGILYDSNEKKCPAYISRTNFAFARVFTKFSPPDKPNPMKRFSAIALLLLLATFAFGQQPKPDTPRDLICDMSKVEAPTVTDFKNFCTRLYNLYPDPKTLATYELQTKLFMNKMRGVVKRGMTWEQLPPAQRSSTAAQAIDYVKSYLNYEPGAKVEKPEGFLQSGAPCLLRDLKYENLDACNADVNYMVLNSVTDASLTKIIQFWEVLNYVTLRLDCSANHS